MVEVTISPLSVAPTQRSGVGQSRPRIWNRVGIGVGAQPEIGPVGSRVVSTVPTPPATQKSAAGQSTPVIAAAPLPGSASPSSSQAPAPAIGLVELANTGPPTATQSGVGGQETLCSGGNPVIRAKLQAAAPPVGLIEVRIAPSLPTATQSPVLGQEMPKRRSAPGISVTFQAPGPPIGLVEVRTEPLYSTATQRLGVGQSTACRLPLVVSPGGSWKVFQALASPVGLDETAKDPAVPTPTQRLAEGQDIPCRLIWLRLSWTTFQFGAAAAGAGARIDRRPATPSAAAATPCQRLPITEQRLARADGDVLKTPARVQTSRAYRYRQAVSKARPAEEDPQPRGLPRLPPGRHGLPRDYVVQNQRDRLAAGIIAAVAEHGYHETTITQITAAAGVSRRTFYAYFSSKEECYFDTYDLIAKHLREAVAEAAAPFAEWPDRVRAKVLAMLEFFAANPDLARFVLIAPPRAGEEIADRYRVATERALAELTEGVPAKGVREPSETVQQSLIGGIVALIVRQVDAGDGKDLPTLLPGLLELFLTPYLGREEAVRVARAKA